MSRKEIAKKYIEYLDAGNLDQLLSLFTSDAIINSPIYGRKNYIEFYTDLFADTTNSSLTTKGIFEDHDAHQIALYFNYHWTLASKKEVYFDVVDILKFDSFNKITELTIIYDTVISRQLVQQLKS